MSVSRVNCDLSIGHEGSLRRVAGQGDYIIAVLRNSMCTDIVQNARNKRLAPQTFPATGKCIGCRIDARILAPAKDLPTHPGTTSK